MIWHSSEAQNVVTYFGVDASSGLSTGVADARLEEYGHNTVQVTKKSTFKDTIFKQLKSYSNILILLASILSFIVYLLYDKSKWFYPVFSLLVLAFYIAMNVYSYKKCEKVIDGMKSRVNPKATVLRDSIIKKIDSSLLVPGDILLLEPGDYIPADARLIESEGLRCDEKFVTGETVPVQKDCYAVLEDIVGLKDRANMVYSGSSVLSGKAKAIVTETAMNCEIGKQVSILKEFDSANINVKEQFSAIGKISGGILLIGCLAVFLIYVLINFHNGQRFAVMLSEAFVNSAALLISVLPEGLPIVAGIAVALSVLRLLKDGVIVKNFDVFNKLPDISVICADKTGILTQNNMNVVSVFNGSRDISVDNIESDSTACIMLKMASLCTNQTDDDRDSVMYNDPTELAIIRSCMKASGEILDDFWNKYPRVCKLPFNPESKIMTSVNIIDGKPLATVKGAPDYLLTLCPNTDIKLIEKQIKKYTKQGLRVIAVAYKQLDEIPSIPTEEELESNLIFMGLIALEDKLQRGIVGLIEGCMSAGIKTVMLTGDHNDTARAIARRLGILKDGLSVVSGAQLSEINDEQLFDEIKACGVFARISPQDKERIVDILKSNGETVAVTGDSVNDAPALKNADAGIAMGNFGTDVARGAADIILNDNSYKAIVTAVAISKQLLSALKKTVIYLFSCNLGEFLTILISLIAFKKFPVIAVQLLFINLLTDSFPIFSIISDSVKNTSRISESSSSLKKLFTTKSIINIAVQSIVIAVVSIVAFALGKNESVDYSHTMTFLVLCLAQFFNMVTTKSESFFYKIKHFMPSTINIPLALCPIILTLLTVSPLGNLIGLTSLSFAMYLKCIILASLPFFSGELIKLSYCIFNRLKAKNE